MKSNNKKAEQPQINGENIDASTPNYNNCTFLYIENFVSAMPVHPNAILSQQQMTPEQHEQAKREIIDYIQTTTNFSPELIERVLDCVEDYLRTKFGGNKNI
jgi:hypothetical protein